MFMFQRSSARFIVGEHCVLQIYYILLIHSSANEHLSCFYLPDTANGSLTVHVSVFVTAVSWIHGL